MEKTIYVLVALKLKSDNEITDQIREEVVNEMDYNFTSQVEGVSIVDSEIKDDFDSYPTLI